MSMFYRYYSKKPSTISRIVRIRIPPKIYKKIRNNFVNIKINNTIEFLYKISKEKRFVIPKEINKEINFLDNNLIEIEEIKPIKRTREKIKIKNNKIELIQIIPRNTRSGMPINLIIKKEKLICFYKSKRGMLRKIELKKEVPLEFCRFLGYYQAEGGKEKKINKRKGRQVVFTNTNQEIISDFLSLSKNMLETNLWYVEIRLKENNRKKEEFIKNMLENLGIDKKNIKIRIEKNLKDFSIRLYICSTILSDIIIKLMEEVKNYLIIKNVVDSKENLKMYVSFMQGLFAGDGNYNAYKNKEGGTHHKLIFYEEDYKYALQYCKLLKKIGINSKVIKIKNKHLFIIKSTLNWKYLLLIKELGLFDYHARHKSSLIKAIQKHKSYKSHKYLADIDKDFNIEKIQDIMKKERVICYNWIRKMIDRGMVIKKDINQWSLSKESKRINKILSEIS